MTAAPARIQVHIDSLVLRGIAPADRAHLVAAFEGELSRILADRTTRRGWTQSGSARVMRLGSVPFVPGPAGSRALGRRIARAIAGARTGQ